MFIALLLPSLLILELYFLPIFMFSTNISVEFLKGWGILKNIHSNMG